MAPLPRAYSIEIRRSIGFFLVTLTFALLSKDLGWATLVVSLIVAYAILSLDLIGSALQNPFAIHNLGALPLDEICLTIEGDLLGSLGEERGRAEGGQEIHNRGPEEVDSAVGCAVIAGKPGRGGQSDERAIVRTRCGLQRREMSRCSRWNQSADP